MVTTLLFVHIPESNSIHCNLILKLPPQKTTINNKNPNPSIVYFRPHCHRSQLKVLNEVIKIAWLGLIKTIRGLLSPFFAWLAPHLRTSDLRDKLHYWLICGLQMVPRALFLIESGDSQLVEGGRKSKIVCTSMRAFNRFGNRCFCLM